MTYGRVVAACLAVGLLSLTGAASSWAHGSSSTSLSEQQLRRVGTRVLGADHAAEHARQRRIERRERARWLRLSPEERRRRLARRERSRRQLVARVATTTDPAKDGRWSGQVKIPVTAVHAALLPTGKVIWFSRPDADGPPNEAMAYLWDPSKPLGDPTALRRVDPPVNPDTGGPANIWCAGQSLLSDGQLLVTGGNLGYASSGWNYKGLQRVYPF